METVPGQTKSNKLFLIIMSIMSSAQVVAGGIVLIDAIPADTAGIIMLIVGAVQAGIMYYLNGQIVPLDKVVAYQPSKSVNPSIYAGGAAPQPTGQILDVNAPLGVYAEAEYQMDESGHGENG